MLSFAPDAVDIAPEVLQLVSAVPTVRGYKTPPAGVDLGYSAMSAASKGGALLYKLDGTTRTIVGTATTLEELTSGAFVDVSRVANYSIGTNLWRFAQYGNTSLAINLATVLQSSVTGDFADVANAPKAAFIDSSAGFTMLANTDDSSLSITGGPNAADKDRWWCSQIFNPTATWAPDISTQCTTGRLVETQGAITGLRRLQNDFVAFKAKSMYLGRYVGAAPPIWQWQCVSTDVGCKSNESVIVANQLMYFIGDDDIYAFDSARPIGIGGGIKEWFFARLNRGSVETIKGIHDRINRSIYWFYPTSSTALDSCLVYHYDTQRWGHFSLTVTDVLEAVNAPGSTYDNLGAFFGGPTFDAMPANITYDELFGQQNAPVVSYIGTDKKIYSLTGYATTASLRTGWYGDEQSVSVVTRVRPRYRRKPVSSTITPSGIFDLSGTVVTGSAATINGDRWDVLQAARYHRFDCEFTGVVEIEGLVPTLKPQGGE